MRKLMAANLARLWKDKIFWVAMLAMAVVSVITMFNGCRQAARDTSDFVYTLDYFYYLCMPAIGIFIAVFTGLFLGTEHHDGAIRNKLIVGHTREKIYLSYLATTVIASLMILTVCFIGGLVGIPMLGPWQMSVSQMLGYLAISILMVAALSAIYTLVCMLFTNKGTVLCILLGLGIIMAGSVLYNTLCEPEISSGVLITANGMEVGEPTPNPHYISGTKRTVYEFMRDFVPAGQGIQMADLAVEHPMRMILSDIFTVIATTFCGVFLFRRKDLK